MVGFELVILADEACSARPLPAASDVARKARRLVGCFTMGLSGSLIKEWKGRNSLKTQSCWKDRRSYYFCADVIASAARRRPVAGGARGIGNRSELRVDCVAVKKTEYRRHPVVLTNDRVSCAEATTFRWNPVRLKRHLAPSDPSDPEAFILARARLRCRPSRRQSHGDFEGTIGRALWGDALVRIIFSIR